MSGRKTVKWKTNGNNSRRTNTSTTTCPTTPESSTSSVTRSTASTTGSSSTVVIPSFISTAMDNRILWLPNLEAEMRHTRPFSHLRNTFETYREQRPPNDIGSIPPTLNFAPPENSNAMVDAFTVEVFDWEKVKSESKNQIGVTPENCAELLTLAAAAERRLIVDPANTILPFSEMPTVLLLDCRIRIPDDFSKIQIDFPNVVNVPPSVFNSDAYQQFTSKAEVYKFLQEKCPDLLGKLNSPGYYANIILVDEASTSKIILPFLKIIRLAMLKWNETTKTSIKLIEGGFTEFSKQIPRLIKHVPGLAGLSKMKSLNISPKETIKEPNPQNASSEALAQVVQSHEKDKNKMYIIMNILRDLSQIFYSFGLVKQALVEEHELKIIKDLESQFPEDIKCPICFEIYSGEIIQCANGHCICGKCAVKITWNKNKCPECRLGYVGLGINAGRMRNRVLENVMANFMKGVCKCGESVISKDIGSHAKICARDKSKSKEIKNIEAEIGLKKMEIDKWDQKLLAAREALIKQEPGSVIYLNR